MFKEIQHLKNLELLQEAKFDKWTEWKKRDQQEDYL